VASVNGRGTAGERHGNGMVCVNPSLKRQGNSRGTAWEQHGMCESALTLRSRNRIPPSLRRTQPSSKEAATNFCYSVRLQVPLMLGACRVPYLHHWVAPILCAFLTRSLCF
jgi:hypothetical protein